MLSSYRDETEELNERTRKEAPGSFIQLSDGFTHYELTTPLPVSPRRASPEWSEGDKSDESAVSSASQVFIGVFGRGARFARFAGEAAGEDGLSDVVLVHGFSVPFFIYDPTFEFLTRAGFRVLRYDLFGRGFSDRPKARYNIDLFVRQLGELLDGVGFT